MKIKLNTEALNRGALLCSVIGVSLIASIYLDRYVTPFLLALATGEPAATEEPAAKDESQNMRDWYSSLDVYDQSILLEIFSSNQITGDTGPVKVVTLNTAVSVAVRDWYIGLDDPARETWDWYIGLNDADRGLFLEEILKVPQSDPEPN